MATRTSTGSRRARQANRAAASGFQQLIDTAEEMLEDLKGQSGAAVEALREKVSATATSARERLADLGPQLSDAATDALESSATFVRNDPWRAVALGALAYIALSFLFSGNDE